MNKLTTAALALAAIGLVSTAASAQTVTAGTEDLILGFQVPAGDTGAGIDLEVDLGSYLTFNYSTLTFNFSAQTPTTTLTQLNVNDLIHVYGSNWAKDVTWSVAANTSLNGTIPEFGLTSTTVLEMGSQAALDAPYGLIEDLAPGLNGQPSTANSSSAAIIGTFTSPAATDPESYTSLELNAAGPGYGYAGNAEATGASTNEFYDVTPFGNLPASDIGTFSLSSAGVLTFTGAAIEAPEPSTYGMIIGAMGVLFLLIRRRRSLV